MPIKGARYRYQPKTNVRLAFKDGEVVEAKNVKTGAVHTQAEFQADKKLKEQRRAKTSKKGSKR